MLSARGTIGSWVYAWSRAVVNWYQPGTVILRLADGTEEIFFASGGFLEIQPGFVTVLADVAARAEDLDEAQAEEARRQLRKRNPKLQRPKISLWPRPD